ncbi:MAG: hypothetical protein EOM41_00920 [Bacilli bacterium]|nr:hypothetical protein [Bacilli bacterium]
MTSRFDIVKQLDNSVIDFTQEYNDVILWNAISLSNNHDHSKEAIQRQLSLVMEEYKELCEAVDSKDLIEIYDALGDIFVVAGYWLFLNKAHPKLEGFVIDPVSALENIYYQPKILNEPDKIDVSNLFQDALNALASLKGGKECLQEVLRSNMSKFAQKDFFEDKGILPEVVAANIEVSSNGRYKNVVPIYSLVVDNETGKEVEYIVFRCDGGKSKLLKPFYFQEPKLKEIIEQYI